MKRKIVATYFLSEGNYPEEVLNKVGAEFLRILCKTPEEIIQASRDADVIVTSVTLQPFPQELIEKLGSGVRHIASAGVGYENIDLQAATERRIVVTNTPLYCIDEVSDHAMALILGLARKLSQVDKAARNFEWRINSAKVRTEILAPMKKLRGQVLGLIGFGNIARAVVPKAKGFGMKVIACDPNASKEIMESHFGVEKVELEELLKKSDFISLHVSLSDKTRKMIQKEHFWMMKPSAYFINTSRGGLVDEKALILAFKEKWIAGAGLDVMDPEPPAKDNPILQMENVIISGHSAQYSDESEKELWQIPVEEAVLTIQGKFPRFSVNPKVKGKWLKKWSKGGEIK